MKLQELFETTFAGGQDPRQFTSPKGGKPVILFVTGQGSRYIITDDGMLLRYKSFHANTGGADQGMQSWSDHIEFFEPTKIGGTTFPQAVAKAVEKRLPVALSKKGNQRALVIYKDNSWQIAKISDIFKHVASDDAEIVANYSTSPKLNWDPMDYDLGSNGAINRVHPGSPVTHGMKL